MTTEKFSLSNFSEFVSGLCDEITEIYNAKRVNDTAKHPASNGEYWVQIADTVTEKCPRVQVWGFYTPDNNGVTVEVLNTETDTRKTIEVVENGSCLIDRLCALIGSIGSLIGINFETIDKYLFCLILSCLDKNNENGLADRCFEILKTEGLKDFYNTLEATFYVPDFSNIGCKSFVGLPNGGIWNFSELETQTINKAMNILLLSVDY